MPPEKFIEITECPRDAMQGWPTFIPTLKKIQYLRMLMQAGFQTLDFGSFVSSRAIPQMCDTKDVIRALNPSSSTKLLAITANLRGAREAMLHDNIDKIGFPFSLSETFQLRNTNHTIATSLDIVKEVQELSLKNKKVLVVYLSMGFGNPYGDIYSADLVLEWVDTFRELGISDISVADTVGIASPEQVNALMKELIAAFPEISPGIHLHALKNGMTEKVDAALDAGCCKFDSAIKGIGGCPMSGSELVGNIDTEILTHHLESKGYVTGIDKASLTRCSQAAAEIFT